MLRHASTNRDIQRLTFERLGHSWTFDFQTYKTQQAAY